VVEVHSWKIAHAYFAAVKTETNININSLAEYTLSQDIYGNVMKKSILLQGLTVHVFKVPLHMNIRNSY